jgi:alkylhydroperoxidase family enzyme
MSRIPPITREEWTDEVRDVVTTISAPETREEASASRIIQTMAQHPALAISYFTFSRHLLKRSSLPDRLRELTTLRVACLFRSEYEWSEHVRLGRNAGLTDTEIGAIRDHGSDWPEWSPIERQALRAVEQMRAGTPIDDETWDGLSAELSRRQIMDFLFTVGGYAMLGMVLTAIGFEPEPDHKGFAEPP